MTAPVHPPRGLPRPARPFGALFDRLAARPAPTGLHAASAAPPAEDPRQPLRDAAQLALQVEFSTIPVYLCGLYAIADPGSHAYQALRSVVMEEMFHANLAANLVVALGAGPRFTGDAAPVYPGWLPHANEHTTPLLGLYRPSADVFANVFAAIETPAPWSAPAQGDCYDTIAQLYRSLSDAILAFPGNPFEAESAAYRQRTDIYLGKYGGEVRRITDAEGALAAIGQIVRQGEGAVPPDGVLQPREPFGTWNQYGERTDGTYGPILGTPEELSHFMKFRAVARDPGAFPATRPIVSNPRLEDFSSPEARHTARVFDIAYSVMLVAFEQSFARGVADPFFGTVLGLMHEVLPSLAAALMSTPAHSGGDETVGPNAAPLWTWVPGADVAQLGAALRHALGLAPATSARAAHLARAMRGLSRIAAPGAAAHA